ncbi:filamin-A-like isoform X3 [Salvelinus alpinus]|uniref:filamin-A-like isoform X3 n=1 Tax=Salvelinus alpinus TaxID=8036 RepID=UPI0039FC948E
MKTTSSVVVTGPVSRLGVPQVSPRTINTLGIAPEEIIDPRVDEQSIMTYHSMFPKAQLKPGAPLNPQSGSMDKSRAERCACDL